MGVTKKIESAGQLLKDAIAFQLGISSSYFDHNSDFYNWVLKNQVNRKADLYGHQWKINGYYKPVFSGPGIKTRTFQILVKNNAVDSEASWQMAGRMDLRY